MIETIRRKVSQARSSGCISNANAREKHAKGEGMKLLSIAVPSYNAQDYLDRCMESLLPGGDDVEILIVDDGSKDRTAEIADAYARKYPNIVKAIHKPNGGHGDAVTTGLYNATGLYFKVVDSDDKLAPKAYQEVLAFLKKTVDEGNDLDMLISNFTYDKQSVPEEKRKVIDYHKMLPVGRFFTWDEIGKFQVGHYLLMHAVIYRTEMLREMKLVLPKHTFYVDNIYVYEPLPHVKTLYYLDVNLYLYYIGRNDQSVNTEVMKKRIDQQDRVNRIMFDYCDLEKVENEKVRGYMYDYLQIMCTVTSAYYALINTKEAVEKQKELWNYMKVRNLPMWKKLRFSLQGVVLNLPGAVGRFIIRKGYFAAQKLFGFN